VSTLFRTTDITNDGRNVHGRALRFEVVDRVVDPGMLPYFEAFATRSVARTLRTKAERPAFVAHRHLAGSVGEVMFSVSGDELLFDVRIADTKYAQRTLEQITDPTHPEHLASASIGFRPIAHVKRPSPAGEITYRTDIALAELSFAPVGQRTGAEVLAVRSELATPQLDALRRRRSLLVMP
jgi:hypothetical protein